MGESQKIVGIGIVRILEYDFLQVCNGRFVLSGFNLLFYAAQLVRLAPVGGGGVGGRCQAGGKQQADQGAEKSHFVLLSLTLSGCSFPFTSPAEKKLRKK